MDLQSKLFSKDPSDPTDFTKIKPTDLLNQVLAPALLSTVDPEVDLDGEDEAARDRRAEQAQVDQKATQTQEAKRGLEQAARTGSTVNDLLSGPQGSSFATLLGLDTSNAEGIAFTYGIT